MNLKFWQYFRRTSATPLDINTELENIKIRWEDYRARLIPDTSDLATTTSPITINSARSLKRIRSTVLKFFSQIFRNGYQEPEWDFAEVDRAIQKESLLRRAIEKYVEQIWKNGFEFTGKNPNTVKYIRKRFRQMAQVSGITPLQLFQQMAYSLVTYGNVLLVKRRSIKASGGRPWKRFDGKVFKPVAAYFPLSPTSVVVDRDEYGVVRKWKQRPTYGLYMLNNTPEWHPDDVIFFKDNTNTDSHYFFAMPMALPVIPDIKALRETEELAILQAIKFAVPRYHARVGERERPATQDEINNTAFYLDSLPSDAVIVTSSRVEIDNIASGDQVLDLERYLEYWWNRILAGLGMSRVGFGQGNTANRNTAEVMAGEMQNTTIKFQQILKDAIETYILRELLYELGYTEETLSEDNMVYLYIPEIDLENKIKKENHVINMFQSNMLTLDEARQAVGLDKLSASEEARLFSNLFGKTEQNKEVATLDQPENQYGKQASRPKVKKDAVSGNSEKELIDEEMD